MTNHSQKINQQLSTRRFVAHTGFSPARFLIDARIARARQLLSETTMSVTQVAGALGYPDVAYFSRQFKRHTGHSPLRTRDPGPYLQESQGRRGKTRRALPS